MASTQEVRAAILISFPLSPLFFPCPAFSAFSPTPLFPKHLPFTHSFCSSPHPHRSWEHALSLPVCLALWADMGDGDESDLSPLGDPCSAGRGVWQGRQTQLGIMVCAVVEVAQDFVGPQRKHLT